jgi:membrane protease YdiL (CAAX protease family)
MKRCTYCGKEYSDEIAQCPVDGMVLVGEESAVPPVVNMPARSAVSSPPSSPATVAILTIGDRPLRVAELLLICVVAFGGSIVLSIYSLFLELPPTYGGAMRWSYGVVHETAALALLWYVLLRRSRSFADLGLRWKWSDFGWSLILWFGGGIAVGAIYRLIYYSGLTSIDHQAVARRVTHYLFGEGVFVGTLIFQCINPFFEELIVRAYFMTEVRQLTNSLWKPVVLSTALQMSYHFYQGVPMTIAAGVEFLIWSLYYAKTKRITPIIMAHLYADVSATLWYMARH